MAESYEGARTPASRQASQLLGVPIMCALRDRLVDRTRGMGDQSTDPVVTLTARLDTSARDQILVHSVMGGREIRAYTGNRSSQDQCMVMGQIRVVRGDRSGERAIEDCWALLNEIKQALDDDLALGTGFGNVFCQIDDYDLICIPADHDSGSWAAICDFSLLTQGRIVAPGRG